MTPTGHASSSGAVVGTLDAAHASLWLAASPAALACVDADGRLRWANAALAALLGAAEAAGAAGAAEAGVALAADASLAGALELDTADAAALASTLAAGGVVDVRRDAAVGARWLRIDCRALGSGERLLAVSDVDALKAADERAQRLAELVDLAREMGRIGVWERDLRSGRGRWDRQMFRMRGLDDEGEAPSIDDMLNSIIPVDRASYAEAFRRSMQQAGSYEHRYRAQGPDGNVRRLHSQWIVKNGSDGRPQRVLGLVMDDTKAWVPVDSYDEMVSQLALAVDLAGIAIWRHDLASGRMHYNAQAYAMLDIAPRADGLPFDEVRALIHPDDQAQVQASAEAALAGSRPTDTEARYRRSDGQWRTVLTRRALQRDSDGRPVAFIGVSLDVTERTEEARRATELARRFELATRAAGIGHWSIEGGNPHARWSDQLRAIHGLAVDAAPPTLNEWIEIFVHPEDRDDVRRRFFDWLKSGRRNLEADFRIVRSDGEIRSLITHSRVEGRQPHSLLFGLIIDATERRSAEMALQEANERASLAARGAGIGTWEVDLRNDHAYWDEPMWRLRGLEPLPTPPSAAARMAMIHPDDRATLLQQEATPSSDGQRSYEFRVVLPDGSQRWIASRSTEVRDDNGRALRRIGVNWDVTDTRTADRVRREREIALRENQAKSKFLARMSHELRTPLNAVLGFAQLLLAEERGDDDAANVRRRRAEHVRAAGNHLLELINDVLDLSSLEGGEVRIALQPVALAPLVRETMPLLEPMLRQRRIELVAGALDVVALADATRLRQLLLNLLSNAVKYNRDDGRVTIDAERIDGSVLIRIGDSGRGMNEQQLAHLFEPFNRLGVERENIEGSGIGLAIVKALVERMNGTIRVESTPGVGSLFELCLADGSTHALADARPHLPAAAAPAPLDAPANAAPPLRATLLYIEDNPVNALIISELLARRADLRLHIAVDGLSGVAKALELRPDLVLLDMQLPDIDGHEVLRRLRADSATRNIPVIALSANAMPDDIERALRAGMSDYWTKPLDFRAFMASMDTLFGPG